MTTENAEREAIERACLDYIEGWYDGDGERMRGALHADLAKRKVRALPSGHEIVEHMSADLLAEVTRLGRDKDLPEAQRLREVTILDVFDTIATAKIVSHRFVDYAHLARVNGEWRIVNVLWELKAEFR
jgi:hypothetical protein